MTAIAAAAISGTGTTDTASTESALSAAPAGAAGGGSGSAGGAARSGPDSARPDSARPEAAPPEAAPLETARLALGGMSCASCVARVERALTALPGVVAAGANFGTGRVEADFRPPASRAGMAAALARAGYPVVPVTVDLAVEGMTCAACTGRVERMLKAQPGVAAATANLALRRARVEAWEADPPRGAGPGGIFCGLCRHTAGRGETRRSGRRGARAVAGRRAGGRADAADLHRDRDGGPSRPGLSPLAAGQSGHDGCSGRCSSSLPPRCWPGRGGASTARACRRCCAAAPT
jgi:copper chaperone CopZ